jgi:hypothetical protein
MFITPKSPTIFSSCSQLPLLPLSQLSPPIFQSSLLHNLSQQLCTLFSRLGYPLAILCRDIYRHYCEHIDIALRLLRPKRLPPPSQPASFSTTHSYRLGPVSLVSLAAPTRADERSEILIPCNNGTRHNSYSPSGLTTLNILQC